MIWPTRKLIAFFRELVAYSDGEVEAERFEDRVRELAARRQWDCSELVAGLQWSVEPYARPNVSYLAVTREDMFARDCNFLFGWTFKGYGVVSYHRFTANFNDETPNRPRLRERTLTQCLSSAGLIFGIKRCSTPTCPRAYPHSLKEHDAKSTQLCPACKRGFKEKFGQE